MTASRHIFIILFSAGIFTFVAAQSAPERTAPYTAVQWDGETPSILIDGEWYVWFSIEGVDVASIVEFSKEKYRKNWRKRISEDLVEVLDAMGHKLPVIVRLSVKKGSKSIVLTKEMTTKNRRAARDYNKEGPIAEEAKDSRVNTATLQKDIAKTVNLSMEKPFQIKAAKVDYVVEGHKLFTGTETLYFDDFGKTVVVIIDKPGLMNNPEKKTTIWKDNKTTVIDHLKKSYFTSPIRPKSTEPPTISYSNSTQRKQGGYEAKPTEKVCGKDCEVFRHRKMDVSYWLWKGINLKERNYSVNKEMGYVKEAKSVEEISAIPAGFFSIPTEYKKQ